MDESNDRGVVLATLKRLTVAGLRAPVTETIVAESGLLPPFSDSQAAHLSVRARVLRALGGAKVLGQVERGRAFGDWTWSLLAEAEVAEEVRA